jgi:hypothetical protein
MKSFLRFCRRRSGAAYSCTGSQRNKNGEERIGATRVRHFLQVSIAQPLHLFPEVLVSIRFRSLWSFWRVAGSGRCDLRRCGEPADWRTDSEQLLEDWSALAWKAGIMNLRLGFRGLWSWPRDVRPAGRDEGIGTYCADQKARFALARHTDDPGPLEVDE